MPWKITPEYKKNVTEIEIWKKDDQYLKRVHGWRWGEYTAYEEPDLSDYDPEVGIDVNSLDGDQGDLDDGQYEEWEFPEGMTEEQQQELMDAWEEDWHEGISNLGWEEWETELWFRGPLLVEEIADDDDEESEDDE